MKEINLLVRQAFTAVSVAAIAVAALLPTVLAPRVFATGSQVPSRSITMSTSSPGATGVTYTVTFTPATTTTNPDYIIDFCSNDPLVGDSCTATAGTDVPNMSAATAKIGATTMTVATIGTNRGLKITGTSTYTQGTPTTIVISNVTNPSNTASFYARIIVYGNGQAGVHTSDSPGTSYVDFGGDALSTVSNISITAKVFETLSFCVYTGSCGTAPALTLGDAITGALSTSNTYVNADAKFNLATNAGHGVSVVMRGTTLCSTTGVACQTGTASSSTITPVGTTPVAFSSSTGSEQFGMCVDKNSSAALTISSDYTDSLANCHGLATGILSTANTFGFDNTNVNGASGSTILTSAGAVPAVVGGGFAFAANIAATTEAAIYTTSLNMVATSTY